MTIPDEPLDLDLARTLGDFATSAVRPIASLAIAEAAIRAGAPTTATGRVRVLVRPTDLRWLALAAVLAALVAGLLVGGAAILRREAPTVPLPTPTAPLPTATVAVPVATPFGQGTLFTPTATWLHQRDYGAVPVLLADGRVAVIGGGSPQVEIWDPVSGASVEAGALTRRRVGGTATRLDDGRILLTGGFDAADPQQTPRSDAELYDPVTGRAVAIGAPLVARMECHCGTQFRDVTTVSAIRLLDGRVLIVGGKPAQTAAQAADGTLPGPAPAELYDPVRGTVRQVLIDCDAARGVQALLHDGRVLVTCLDGFPRIDGATVGPGQNHARLFDPATATFVATGAPTGTNTGAATVLPDGRVLVTGDGLARGTSTAEVYDPATGTFTALPGFNTWQRPLVLADGRILFATFSSERSGVFDPASMTFSEIQAAITLRLEERKPLALGDSRVLYAGPTDGLVVDTSQLP